MFPGDIALVRSAGEDFWLCGDCEAALLPSRHRIVTHGLHAPPRG
jgi:hypothetical protein